MTNIREQDLAHANERGNGPKNRMEGGDQTDDIAINSPEERRKEKSNASRKHDKAIGYESQPKK